MAQCIDFTDIKTLKLEKLRFGINRVISEQQLMDMDINVLTDRISRDILVKLRYSLIGENVQNIVKFISYPKTVWQYFKSKYCPRWFIRRYPVEYEDYKVEFKRVAVFPDLSKELALSSQYASEALNFYVHETLDTKKL